MKMIVTIVSETDLSLEEYKRMTAENGINFEEVPELLRQQWEEVAAGQNDNGNPNLVNHCTSVSILE